MWLVIFIPSCLLILLFILGHVDCSRVFGIILSDFFLDGFFLGFHIGFINRSYAVLLINFTLFDNSLIFFVFEFITEFIGLLLRFLFKLTVRFISSDIIRVFFSFV